MPSYTLAMANSQQSENRILACLSATGVSSAQIQAVKEGAELFGNAGVVSSLELVSFLGHVEVEFSVEIYSADPLLILDSLHSLNRFSKFIESLLVELK